MTEKHTHKLKRLKYKSGNSIFFCALPDCSFKINTSLALGKRSICWRCGEPFIMTEYCLRLVKPHCEGCHKPKKEVIDNNDHEYAVEPMNIPESKAYSLAERLEQTIRLQQRISATKEEDEI